MWWAVSLRAVVCPFFREKWVLKVRMKQPTRKTRNIMREYARFSIEPPGDFRNNTHKIKGTEAVLYLIFNLAGKLVRTFDSFSEPMTHVLID